MNNPLVSIIIRTKNESKWIAACLQAVYSQTYKNIEVIIVDNESIDATLNIVSEFPAKLVHIENFKPGLAINKGIRASLGDYIVCLSGHCVPTNDSWLETLINDLSNPSVGGIYGRQEPLSYSSDQDKRDLLTVFGLDRIVQIKNSFFHNANSAFRREVWEQFPFDEDVSNVEDRIWGAKLISQGYQLIYEPEASVFHWHGIHHAGSEERCKNVVKILEAIPGLLPSKNDFKGDGCVAIIPIKGASLDINGETLLERTVAYLKKSHLITHIVVSSDTDSNLDLAKELGVFSVKRPEWLSRDYVDIFDVVRYTYEKLISDFRLNPNLVALVEEGYLLRPSRMIDEMIFDIRKQSLDAIVPVISENRGIWFKAEDEIKLLGDGFMPRQFKTQSAFIGLLGLGVIMRSEVLRMANPLRENIGMYIVPSALHGYQFKRSSDWVDWENFIGLLK